MCCNPPIARRNVIKWRNGYNRIVDRLRRANPLKRYRLLHKISTGEAYFWIDPMVGKFRFRPIIDREENSSLFSAGVKNVAEMFLLFVYFRS